MAALGELIIVCTYIALFLLALVFLLKTISAYKKGKMIMPIIGLVISSLVLIIFSYSQYMNHRSSEMEKVGVYYLISYPNCATCILELKKDNTYSVKKEENILEKGAWYFKSGGDYWITFIGDFGQLGNGKYRYNYKETIENYNEKITNDFH